MSDDALKTFDNLTSISNQDIDDDLDIVPITHGIGTVSQGDKKVKIGQFQQMTVLRCRTAGNVVNKQAEYVGGLPLNGNGQSCVGRTVLVIFENKNTADSPTFSYNNLTGPIKLLNQSSNVTLGTGCINANSRNIMTWDGESWCLHSNIAKVTSGYTEYADGRIEQVFDADFSNSNTWGQLTVDIPHPYTTNDYYISIVVIDPTQISYPGAILDTSVNVTSFNESQISLIAKTIQVNQGDTFIANTYKYTGIVRITLIGY